MDKKIIGIIILVALVLCGGLTYFLVTNQKDDKTPSEENRNSSQTSSENNGKEESNESMENNNQQTGNKKVLVVYFSATNNTKNVAEKIASNLNADLFEIEPSQEYTQEDLNWTNENSRVSREHNDESLRNVELKTTRVANWDSYDTILIGYPIWFGIAAWPVDTFVTSNDFNGKTVIPFCTSSSSGLGQSGNLLANKANGGNWKEGERFSSNPTDQQIKTFTDNMK